MRKSCLFPYEQKLFISFLIFSFQGGDDDSSEVHLSRMLQILREFAADPILSTYVIDDVWDYMGAMKVRAC